MAFKIDKKIVSFSTAQKSDKVAAPVVEEVAAIELMNEHVGRPDVLVGSTYKIKTPLSDHALYITINDIVLNPGTNHEQRQPYEVFINSKNLEYYQWVVALTRVISAVFRKGGDVTFLVEELKAVFDPQGGYFKSGGRFMPSLVAEIGHAIEDHMKMIGLIKTEELTDIQKEVMAQKLKEYNDKNTPAAPEADGAAAYPASSSMCQKCHTKAVIIMDGCKTCLSCGDSKCG